MRRSRFLPAAGLVLTGSADTGHRPGRGRNAIGSRVAACLPVSPLAPGAGGGVPSPGRAAAVTPPGPAFGIGGLALSLLNAPLSAFRAVVTSLGITQNVLP